jgi:hypothetical protein
MKRVIVLIFLLTSPIFASSTLFNEELIDNINMSFEFYSEDEIVSHYESQLYCEVTFDFSLSKYQNVSSVIINNFTFSYIAYEEEAQIIFDQTTFLDKKASNTSNPFLYKYEEGVLEQLESNPFPRSRIDVLISVDFTITNLDANSSYSVSSLFSGPILNNPLSIIALMRNMFIIGSLLVISVILIIKRMRKNR